ncbi:MAG: hypothetical protein GSR81_06320 [Desulfurococcales archaeon]|nr:hypothetical protein [Desulfurococcales archaeon]
MKQEEMIRYAISITANNLEELLGVSETLSKIILDTADPATIESISELLLNAIGLREKIIEVMELAQSIVKNSNELDYELLIDLYTIAGYYAMEGYKTDKNSIARVSSIIDVSRSLDSINKLYTLSMDLYKTLDKILNLEK